MHEVYCNRRDSRTHTLLSMIGEIDCIVDIIEIIEAEKKVYCVGVHVPCLENNEFVVNTQKALKEKFL